LTNFGLVKKLTYIILFFALFIFNNTLFSQCAMCKAVVESDLESGGKTALGINNGILYLMIIPYLLIAIVGFFIYKNYKKNSSSIENHEQ